MKPRRHERSPEAARFRVRLLVTMMLVVSGVAAVTLVYARRNLAADERRHLEREFRSAIETLHQVREVRTAALLERCRALAQKPRIHAALEDDALDLLYLNARDELRDVLAPLTSDNTVLRAQFYRFLDRGGRVISPTADARAGDLTPDEERRLDLPEVPRRPHLGYLSSSDKRTVAELIATPIISIFTSEPIGALVLGFAPITLDESRLPGNVGSGVLTDDALHLNRHNAVALRPRIEEHIVSTGGAQGSFEMRLSGEPALVFYQQLNPESYYPPAHEVCIFPLTEMVTRQRRVGWQIVGAGLGLIIGGFIVSGIVSSRFAQPVDQLAHDSAEQRSRRERAEAALQTTSAELQRAARFSADASHQLKTPVTVLRAGLEELLARRGHDPSENEEIAALIRQTYRLSGIIEDLLLLSRIDAGQLRIRFGVVNLSQLIAGALDDLDALPDDLSLALESSYPEDLRVSGEKPYLALILQNLLENARKYNRPGGRIRLTATRAGTQVAVRIANTTLHPVTPEAQEHIFERFHRGVVGENIAGYGLGLNLARELARLHEGDLRLLRSDDEWTEFEVHFRAVQESTQPQERRS